MRPDAILATRRPDLIERASVPRGLRPPEPIPQSFAGATDGLAMLMGMLTTSTNVAVTETNVTGLAAVQAGVDMVSHAVATMMVEANVYSSDGTQLDTPSVVNRPTVLLGSYEFWVQACDVAMKRGNYIGLLADFDLDGYARQIVPIHPSLVSIDSTSGFPEYRIGNEVYSWQEVLHVRHGAPVGTFWGQGIIERYRLALSGQLAQAEYGRSSFASGGIPSAHIQLDKNTLNDGEAEAVDTRWQERFGNGNRKPVVTGKAITITPLSWTPHDAEFVDSRRLSVAEAALMCGLDPADLGASIASNLTYANLTDRQLSRILSAYSPWMTLFEQAWSDLIPGRSFVRGNVEALLRTSTKERFDVYVTGKALGIYTTEELRVMEKRPELPVESEQQTETDPPTEEAAA